jgi:hypothetical protein
MARKAMKIVIQYSGLTRHENLDLKNKKQEF